MEESQGKAPAAGAHGGRTLQDLLRMVSERGGTDLHITVDSPPIMRANGELRPLPMPPLTSSDTKRLCYAVLTENQRHRFEEELELDFSFGIRGLCRFRGNIFRQKGSVAAAFRTVPFTAKSLSELGLPPAVGELTKLPRGLVHLVGARAGVRAPRTARAGASEGCRPRAPCFD